MGRNRRATTTLQARVDELRAHLDRGKTYSDIARIMGFDRSTISKFATGVLGLPKRGTALRRVDFSIPAALYQRLEGAAGGRPVDFYMRDIAIRLAVENWTSGQ